MLGKKPAPAVVQKPTDKIDTLIGPNTEINGDVNFSGGLRVDGKLTGNISAKDASDNSLLTISEQAEISGNVTVPHVVINGIVNGNVHQQEKFYCRARPRLLVMSIIPPLKWSSVLQSMAVWFARQQKNHCIVRPDLLR